MPYMTYLYVCQHQEDGHWNSTSKCLEKQKVIKNCMKKYETAYQIKTDKQGVHKAARII